MLNNGSKPHFAMDADEDKLIIKAIAFGDIFRGGPNMICISTQRREKSESISTRDVLISRWNYAVFSIMYNMMLIFTYGEDLNPI